jgi:hypothetical protein
MQRPVQKILHKIGHDLEPERWIFVLGCYNSATTLLASILEKHPLIGGLVNEGAFHTDVLPYPEQYGWPRMWCRCLDRIRITEFDSRARAARIKKQWSLLFPKDMPNLVEKSISNLTRTRFLQENFRPAYFIYIVRNGYVVSKGIQRKANYKRWNSAYRKKGYPIELCAEQWVASDEMMTKDKRNLERVFEVRYEDFVENSEEVLKNITDFLGISPMPAMMLQRQWAIHDMNSSIVNMNPSSLKRLTREDFEKIESVAEKTLKKYEYTRSG